MISDQAATLKQNIADNIFQIVSSSMIAERE